MLLFRCFTQTMDEEELYDVQARDNSEFSSNELSPKTLSACIEMAIKDHEAGRAIPHSALMERIKTQRGWK